MIDDYKEPPQIPAEGCWNAYTFVKPIEEEKKEPNNPRAHKASGRRTFLEENSVRGLEGRKWAPGRRALFPPPFDREGSSRKDAAETDGEPAI